MVRKITIFIEVSIILIIDDTFVKIIRVGHKNCFIIS